jgi:hypothetical protein
MGESTSNTARIDNLNVRWRRALYFALHYVLFENAMSVVKMGAMIAGLFELSNAQEWGTHFAH